MYLKFGLSGLTAVWAVLMLGSGMAVAEAQQDPSENQETGTEEKVFPPEIEKLLSETSDPEDYTSLERCISVRQIRRTQILDDRHVIFTVSQNRLFLVQFQHRCPRLRWDSALIYETRSGQLCRLDQIRAGSSMSPVRDIGPPCMIPGFQEVTKEQVLFLEEALKAQRNSAKRGSAG